jgi:hypothetical protein
MWLECLLMLGLMGWRQVNRPGERGTSKANLSRSYPKVRYPSESSRSVSGAVTLLLTEAARTLRLVDALGVELGGFMRPKAAHHPGKAVCDLEVMLAPDPNAKELLQRWGEIRLV